MSTPSIKVGQGNWGIKAGNLLGYANTEKKFSPVEFTSSRALDTATRVNASGNIATVNANVPRIDYFGGQASLLVEPSAANLKPRSDDWTNSTFFLARVTQTQSANVAPLTKPMLEVRETAVTGTHNIQIQPDATLVSGSIYTRSFFVSLAGRDVINFGDSGQSANDCRINFSTKTVISQGANIISSRIVDYGNGLFLVSITFTATGTIGRTSIALFLDNTTQSYLGDITKGVNIHFIQYELGSVGTSYIPNANATGSVTRNADVISVTGAVSGSIGQTEGTVYLEMQADAAGTGVANFMVGGTSQNNIYIGKDSNKMRLRIRIGNVNAFDNSATTLNGSPLKIAVAYQQSGTTRLTNDELATLTTP